MEPLICERLLPKLLDHALTERTDRRPNASVWLDLEDHLQVDRLVDLRPNFRRAEAPIFHVGCRQTKRGGQG